MTMPLTPITLEGHHVRLEPLSLAHLDALCEVGLDEELWRWTPDQARTRDDMRAYILEALADQERGAMLPFATVLKAESRVVGSTRFGNIDLRNRRVEIGWTWIARPWQRTVVNTEAKYLMLRHAFESLGCIRVELKTDALNDRSRQAILRLGAKEEGTLRQHMVMPDGRLRDTVYYSILDREWPEIKVKLRERLD
ncbi:MAG: GNAT family N-acetyltransferase [Verrucomicrobia bacterium]|nr:GNAT family N-acetyltransferase [Verrucomicrobiota bacterium]